MKYAGTGILAGTLFLWDRLVRSQKQLLKHQTITLPLNQHQEFTFHQDVIIVNSENSTEVYSSKCTHLGCTIGQVYNGELVCPCHGSRFNKLGEPVNGPAIRALEKYAYTIDSDNNITIEL